MRKKDRLNRLHASVTLLLILVSSQSLVPSLAQAKRETNNKKYFSYTQFKHCTNLYKILKKPLLAGIAKAGHKLWSEGNLRVPEKGNVLRGDFNRNGNQNIGFIVIDNKSSFLLLSEKRKDTWQRAGLFKLESSKHPVWNGKALKLSNKTFIAWSKGRFRKVSGALALYKFGYQTADFRGVMVKLTYIGPQNHPYPGLLIHSYYRAPDMNAFKNFRTKGIDYNNDDMKALWTLTLPTKKLQTLISTIESSNVVLNAKNRNPTKTPLHHSLTIIDTASGQRPNNYEVFLKAEETIKLLKNCAEKIKNKDAAKLIKEYNTIFGG